MDVKTLQGKQQGCVLERQKSTKKGTRQLIKRVDNWNLTDERLIK